MSLLIRNARLWSGEATDLALSDDRIAAIGQVTSGQQEFDARGATVLPGLHDHHLHILATAARACSVDLSGASEETAIIAALAAAQGTDIRAVGYDERTAGLPDRALLDRWSPDRPLRLQDRTGALWVLNGAALALLPKELPPGTERDEHGMPTGRFWREDRWLGAHWPRAFLDLAALGGRLAALGLTGLTDAGAGNGPDEAATLSGALPQRLMLMGNETLPVGEGYVCGPLKLLIDERELPSLEELAKRIATARDQGRAVAAHCVTATELAIYLAALDAAGGARIGDRIEHGGMISTAALREVAATSLTVVTNPGFLHDRGERYRASIAEGDLPDLYRAASLLAAEVRLAAGSDAPYASFDPWLAMRAARDRLTADGHVLSTEERISAASALRLYQGEALAPWVPRRVALGQPADLILCEGDAADILADLTAQRVSATIIAGEVVFSHA